MRASLPRPAAGSKARCRRKARPPGPSSRLASTMRIGRVAERGTPVSLASRPRARTSAHRADSHPEAPLSRLSNATSEASHTPSALALAAKLRSERRRRHLLDKSADESGAADDLICKKARQVRMIARRNRPSYGCSGSGLAGCPRLYRAYPTLAPTCSWRAREWLGKGLPCPRNNSRYAAWRSPLSWRTEPSSRLESRMAENEFGRIEDVRFDVGTRRRLPAPLGDCLIRNAFRSSSGIFVVPSPFAAAPSIALE